MGCNSSVSNSHDPRKLSKVIKKNDGMKALVEELSSDEFSRFLNSAQLIELNSGEDLFKMGMNS